MSSSADIHTDTPVGINVPAASAWLDTLFGDNKTSTLTPIRGGGSCEIYELMRGEQRLVIRKAPKVLVADSAHNVLREFQIIEALQSSKVRVPQVFGACDDRKIADAPFYVMAFIDGSVVRRRLPRNYQLAPQQQSSIGTDLIDSLVELHAFDWRNSEIASLSKPENYLSRQVDRWLQQYGSYACRELPVIDSVSQWLARHRPGDHELTVMHGDYKLDNVMLSKDFPIRVLSLMDFEMTTVGDPLIDLAWALTFWPEEGNLIAIAAPGTEGGMDAQYCQKPETLVQRYVDLTGRNVNDLQWYQVFAAWKLAIILEASYATFLAGNSNNPNHEIFGFVVDQLLLRAERFAN